MPIDHDLLQGIVGLAACCLTLFFSLPAVRALVPRRRLLPRSATTYTPLDVSDGLYEDRDGIATADSIKAYSVIRPQIAVGLFAAAGLGASVASRVLTWNQTLGRQGDRDSISTLLNLTLWSDIFCWVRYSRSLGTLFFFFLIFSII